MKLIVTGATGFVGTEVIRQALSNNAITSIVALTRRPIEAPKNAGPNADLSKLQTLVLENWTDAYPESVKEQLKGADGCIWTLAVTPSKSKTMDPAEVSKVCHDYTITGLQNMAALANKSFRFVYTSGVTVERDQSKSLWFLADYRRMRGRTENFVLDFSKQHESTVQATVLKPAGIEGPGHRKSAAATAFMLAITDVPWVHVSEIAATLIDQCVNGITKDTLWSRDIVEISSRVLRKEDYLVYRVGTPHYHSSLEGR